MIAYITRRKLLSMMKISIDKRVESVLKYKGVTREGRQLGKREKEQIEYNIEWLDRIVMMMRICTINT